MNHLPTSQNQTDIDLEDVPFISAGVCGFWYNAIHWQRTMTPGIIYRRKEVKAIQDFSTLDTLAELKLRWIKQQKDKCTSNTNHLQNWLPILPREESKMGFKILAIFKNTMSKKWEISTSQFNIICWQAVDKAMGTNVGLPNMHPILTVLTIWSEKYGKNKTILTAPRCGSPETEKHVWQ